MAALTVEIRNMTSRSVLVVGDDLCFSSVAEQVSLAYFLFGCVSKALVHLLLVDTTLQTMSCGTSNSGRSDSSHFFLFIRSFGRDCCSVGCIPRSQHLHW